MKIQLRRANLGDLEFVFNLRNEKVVRDASFNSDLLDLKTHRKWFEKKLTSDESILLIAEINSRPIAQMRFDWLSDGGAEINIAVAEGFRGQGHGSEILSKSSLQFFADFPEAKIIHAFIKQDNLASIRSFGKAGYQLRGKSSQKGHSCIEMTLTR